MANETNTILVDASSWTQIGAAGEQILITPKNPGYSFWIRFSALNPGADITVGHKFISKEDVPNAVVGGANTDNIYIRLVSGYEQEIFITVL